MKCHWRVNRNKVLINTVLKEDINSNKQYTYNISLRSSFEIGIEISRPLNLGFPCT